MKSSLFLLALSLTITSAFANEVSSRGYLMLTGRGSSERVWYAGLNDEGVDVGFDIDYRMNRAHEMTEDHYAQMKACMAKKETHAILVIEDSRRVSVPTEYGTNTTITKSTVTAVECVRAPGYLNVWRQKMNAQNDG